MIIVIVTGKTLAINLIYGDKGTNLTVIMPVFVACQDPLTGK
jgi:hypothetical protein